MATIIQGSADSTFGGTIESTGIDDNATSTAITINSSEQVGIGNTSPSTELHIGDGTAGQAPELRLQSATVYTKLTADDTSGNSDLDFSHTLRVKEAGTEVMRVAAGNVGIGVTPESHYTGYVGLDVGDNAALISNDGGTNCTSLLHNSYLNSGATAWVYKNTDEASMYNQVDGKHEFKVASSGSADAAISWTSAMTIDNAGSWVRGTVSAGNSFFKVTNNATQSHCNTGSTVTTDQGHFYFTNPNGNVGSIRTSGSSTAYNTTSDYRLKENVVPMTGSIDRLKELKPSKFNFIADADTTVDGFLAHEVSDTVPEAISGEKDAMRTEEYEVEPAIEATYDEEGNELTPAVEAVMGEREVEDYQGIDQSKLVPLLTSALQEAVAKIEELTTRIETLENA